ncbi:MAG: hypothetical protein R3C49_24165 [Planctomycetaceae bacterium]
MSEETCEFRQRMPSEFEWEFAETIDMTARMMVWVGVALLSFLVEILPQGFGQQGIDEAGLPPHMTRDVLQFCMHDLGTRFFPVSIEDVEPSVRTVCGQVVDHDSKPLAGVCVVFVRKHKHHSGHDICLENIAVTDREGCFEVTAATSCDLLVFRDESRLVWTASPERSANPQAFSRPEPAILNWNVPLALAKPGDEVTIHGRLAVDDGSELRESIVVQDDGTVRRPLMPGSYFITKSSSIGLWEQEIGPVDAVSGQTVEPQRIRGQATIAGPGIPSDASCHFVIVRQARGLNDSNWNDTLDVYTSTNGLVTEVITPAADGFFLSNRLIPGSYLVHQILNLQRKHPVRPIMTWQVLVTDQREPIRLSHPVYDDSLNGNIRRLLDE